MNRTLTATLKAALSALLLLAASVAAAAPESFNSSFKLATALSITEKAALSFGEDVKGVKRNIVVPAAQGAQFAIAGLNNRKIKASIVEPSIKMTTGNGAKANQQIVVTKWTFGGDLNKKGFATLSKQGKLDNVRVGATAQVKTGNVAGDYQGEATLRVIYADL